MTCETAAHILWLAGTLMAVAVGGKWLVLGS